MVNPRLSEQTIMGLGLGCFIPSFVEIGPLVPGMKIFKLFYHMWACQPSLVAPIIIYINFHFSVSKSLHTKFDKHGSVISEKSKF